MEFIFRDVEYKFHGVEYIFHAMEYVFRPSLNIFSVGSKLFISRVKQVLESAHPTQNDGFPDKKWRLIRQEATCKVNF